MQATAENLLVDVTFRVTVPAFTGDTYPVYIVGPFNSWNPGDPAYALSQNSATEWEITLSILDGTNVQHKYARGSWDRVEKQINGYDEVADRYVTIDYGTTGDQLVEETVANWRDRIVAGHSPADGATGVDPSTVITASWNKWIPTPPPGTFSVTGPGGPVSGAFSWSDTNWTHTFTPDAPLAPGTYTVAISGNNHNGDNQFVPTSFSFSVPTPAVGLCPIGEGVGLLRTDVIGFGQTGRTQKLVVPYFADLDSLYAQLAAVDVGVMRFVRFLPKGLPTIQLEPPTSPAYEPTAVSWWGSDIPPVQVVKGQFFWGSKGNKAPRAFVMWPTYATDQLYANAMQPFGDSASNYVNWMPGWTDTQTQTLSIPATQDDGANITVHVALVDVGDNGRPVVLTVEAGGKSVEQVITTANQKRTLNLSEVVLADVAAGTDDVTITLHSPAPSGLFPAGGDAAAMIGAAANYPCVQP